MESIIIAELAGNAPMVVLIVAAYMRIEKRITTLFHIVDLRLNKIEITFKKELE